MVIARGIITIHHVVDIVSTTWYYKLQASTASAPAKPTTQTPSGWSTTEPAYTEGSTNSLYIVQKTTFSDGTFDYSDVSLSSSYEAAKAAYNKAVTAQETADAIPSTVPGVNLSPFFSHDIDDVYNAESNPNGYWVESGSYGWRKNSKYTFTQLEDGWLHVHIDNSTGTGTIRNDCCCPRFNPVIKPGTKYTFLVEFRNNQTTGAGAGTDFYLVQQSGYVQFWGQNTANAPAAKLEGVGGASTLISALPTDGSYAFSRFTKFSEPEGSDHLGSENIMATFVFRANAGLVVDYDIRISLYLGEYWGPYVPYVVSDTSAIRKAVEDAQASVDALQPELIIGTHGTAATAAWTGTSAVLTEITTGTRIQFKLSSAGASNVTLNLTLKDGTTTGAKAVYYSNTTRLGTQYGAGAVVDLIYDGEAWRVLNPYTNSNTVGAYAGAVKAGTNGVKNYSLVMRDTADTWVSLTTSAGTGTSKARYTGGLYPDKVLYMGSNSAYAAGATTGNCYEALALNLNYSTNSNSTLTSGKAVYLVGEIHSDGLFYLDPVWWTQTLPTTENGKTYIYLGLAYSTSNIYLTPENTLYQFYDGKFRKLSEIEEMKAAKTATNYIYDSVNLGLIVAREAPASDNDVSTIGWHTRQTADGFDVYYNTTRVAHYGTTVKIGDRANSYYLEQTNSGIKIFRENPDGSNIFKDDENDGKFFETVMMVGSHNGEHNVIDQLGVISPADFSGGETLWFTDYSNMISGTLQVWLSAQDNSSKLVLTSGTDYTYEDDELTILLSSTVSNYLTSVYNSTGKYPVGIVNYRIRNTTLHYDFGVRDETRTIGLRSLISGHRNSAQGENSAAFGEGNHSCNDNCTVFGQYNDPDDAARPLFMVGCGTSDSNRKNAFYVKDDGTVVFPGTIEYDALAGDDFRHYLDPESDVSWNTTYVNTSEQLELTIHTWGRIVHVMGTFTAKATIPNAANIATGLPAPEGRIISLYGVNAANNTPINFSITAGGALQKWYAGSIATGNVCRFGGLYIVK